MNLKPVYYDSCYCMHPTQKNYENFFLSDYLRNLEMQIVNVSFCSQREEVKIKNMYS